MIRARHIPDAATTSVMWALGLMSGTSLDGVDAALIKTDGVGIQRVGPGLTKSFPQGLRHRLQLALGEKTMTPDLRCLESDLTLFHYEVLKDLLSQCDIKPDVIGFHGQTLFHEPPITWQLGSGELLAEKTGIPVVYDFRKADVKAGGQGAPLVPIYHQALLRNHVGPLCVLNIGGVANITYINRNDLIAFDTGPGIALIDQWIHDQTGLQYDEGGHIAKQGHCNQKQVDTWLQHPYFSKSYPKSLDRGTFAFVLDELKNDTVSDGARTLCAFTAACVHKGLSLCPNPPLTLWLTGGGRHNRTIVKALQGAISIHNIDELGIDGDHLEAQAFAFLAVRSLKNLPLSFPTTTGVPRPLSGGILASPHSRTLNSEKEEILHD